MQSYLSEARSVDVATSLREMREARGISMRTLAIRSGLSANALSMIERGKTSPSVSTLYKLADALGVSITAFFGAASARKPVVFVRAEERSNMPFSRGMFEALGGENFSGRVESFILTVDSGASSGTHAVVHSGDEFVFCLRGELEYEVGKEVYVLKPGDSLLFESKMGHRWHNTSRSVTNALVVLSGFADGEHPHTMHWKKEG